MQRPLSPEQLTYAAADAACLLGLLGSLVRAVGQPEEWPMAEAEAPAGEDGLQAGGAAAADDAPNNDTQAGAAGADAALPADQAQRGNVAAADAGLQQQHHLHQQQHHQQLVDDAVLPCLQSGQPADALLGGCSLQQLQAAAAAWGSRLEISGSRAVRRSSKRGGQRRRQQQRAARGKAALALGCNGFPLHVPWMDAQRQVSLSWICADVRAIGGCAIVESRPAGARFAPAGN